MLALLDGLVEVVLECVIVEQVPRPNGEIAHVLDRKGGASGSINSMVMQNVIQGDELASKSILEVVVKLCQLADDEVVEVFEVFMAETRKVRNMAADT